MGRVSAHKKHYMHTPLSMYHMIQKCKQPYAEQPTSRTEKRNYNNNSVIPYQLQKICTSWQLCLCSTSFLFAVVFSLFLFGRFSVPFNKAVMSHLCGISRPPSTAPLSAPNTLAPVLVLARPTSRKQRKAPALPSSDSTMKSSPSGSV